MFGLWLMRPPPWLFKCAVMSGLRVRSYLEHDCPSTTVSFDVKTSGPKMRGGLDVKLAVDMPLSHRVTRLRHAVCCCMLATSSTASPLCALFVTSLLYCVGA